MFDTNIILARLQKGEHPKDIANEMAVCLNQAIDMHEAKELKSTLDCAANDISTYLRAKFPKECAALDDELDGEVLGEILDALMTILPMIDALSTLGGIIPTPDVKVFCGPDCDCHGDVDPIAAFLSQMGLKQ